MIRTMPRPHQAMMVKFAMPLDYGFILAAYGTGKTLALLWLIEKMKWRLVIVVSTKTALDSTWNDEIRKHSDYRFARIDGGTAQRKVNLIRMALSRHAKVLLINYDGVRNILDAITAIRPDAVIVDEGLAIKNPYTLRTKVMWALGNIVPKRFITEGNIFSESPTEIYSQTKFLDRGATFGNSYKAFLAENFNKKKGKFVPKKGAAKKIFNLIKPFTIMIPDSVVERPESIFKKIGLEATAQQQELFNSMKKDFRAELGRVSIHIDSIYALLGKSQQICDGFVTDKQGNIQYIETPKDVALVETLEEIGRQKKVIIWTVYIPSLKKLYRILTKLGYNVLVLYGDTKDAGNIVKQFQHSTRYNIILMTLKKGNSSLNLQCAGYSLWYSRSWSFNERDNGLARNSRMGSLAKHKSIMYIDEYIKDSVEEKIIDCLDTKGDLIEQLKKYFK